MSRVEGSPAYPSYPGRANFSYISLQNLANRLHEKQKVGSARRVTRLAGSPFCDGRVTLLARSTFLHINTLARLAGSTRSRRDDQSMREHCWHCKANWYMTLRAFSLDFRLIQRKYLGKFHLSRKTQLSHRSEARTSYYSEKREKASSRGC